MGDSIWRIAENVILSTLHGWAGATLAVYMFFYPLRPWRIGGITIWHGLIPRYQEKIAAAVGTVVGRDLLTKEAIVRYMAENPDFTAAIKNQVKNVLTQLLAQDYGTVGDLLGQAVPGGCTRLVSTVRDGMVQWVRNFLREPGFAAALFDMACTATGGGRCLVEEVVSQSALERLLALLGAWLKNTLASPAGSEMLQQAMADVYATLARERRPVREVLPRPVCDMLYALPSLLAPSIPGLLRQVEGSGVLQKHIDAIAALLVEKIRRAGSLPRLLLCTTQASLALRKGLAEIIEEDLWPRLVAAAASEEGQKFIIRQGEVVLDRLLCIPVAELVAKWEQPVRQSLQVWLREAVQTLGQSEAAAAWWQRQRRRLAAMLVRAPWPIWPRETAHCQDWRADFITAVQHFADTAHTQAVLSVAVDRFLAWLLAQRVGEAKNLLPAKYNTAIFIFLVNSLTELISANMARMVETADVSAIIEREIAAFSPEQLVRLFKDVTLNSLAKIELWGAVIGALLGFFFGLANAMPAFFWGIAAVLLLGTMAVKRRKD